MMARTMYWDGMASDAPWAKDPRWLQLPLEKREAALARMRAVSSYRTGGPHSIDDADLLAATIGVKRARFFELLRIWKRTGSPVDLAPFAQPVRQTGSTMKAERVERLRATAAKVIAEEADRTPAALAKAVRAAWPAEFGSAPARATIQRYLATATAAATRTRSGATAFRRVGGEVAREFGEVLVIDHLAVDLFVGTATAAMRPIATLAIDVATGLVVGGVLNDTAPAPQYVLDALKDTVDRRRGSRGKAVRPRIALNATFAPEWSALLSGLVGKGVALAATRTAALQFGAPGQRLLGGRLNRLKLVPRKGHLADMGASEFDPRRHCALTIKEARQVFEANLAAHWRDHPAPARGRLLIEV